MIIDAHPVVRLGIRRLLEPAEWDFEELPHGGEAVDAAQQRRPLRRRDRRDAHRPRTTLPSGTATIRALLKAQPGIGVVAHGGRVERHSLRDGAGGRRLRLRQQALLARRDALGGACRREVRLVHRSERRRCRRRRDLDHPAAASDPAALRRWPHRPTRWPKRLGLSVETVRTHARSTLPRLGARDRAHAIAIALRGSLID